MLGFLSCTLLRQVTTSGDLFSQEGETEALAIEVGMEEDGPGRHKHLTENWGIQWKLTDSGLFLPPNRSPANAMAAHPSNLP